MSSLPELIPPQPASLGKADADGNVIIDMNWYLFLYNIARQVLNQSNGSLTVSSTDLMLIDLDDMPNETTQSSTALKTIAVLADSHGATNQMMPAAWTSIVQQELNAKGHPATVYSCALDGLSYYRALNPPSVAYQFGTNNAVQQVISYKPDIVLVMLGGNDTWVYVDGRTLAQVKTDALAVFATLRAGLPNAVIIYVSEVWYDATNYATPQTTLVNQGCLPYFWDLSATTPAICVGSFCSEALGDNTVNPSLFTYSDGRTVKQHAGDWLLLDAYIKALTPLQGVNAWFKEDYWRVARMGGDMSDLIHPNGAGRYLQSGYIMQGLKNTAATSALLPKLNTNNQADWEDPDSLFLNMFRVSLGIPTAWDPANVGTGIVLSNANLTEIMPGGTAVGGRSVLGVTTGKWYWEVTVGASAAPAQNEIGVCNASYNVNTELDTSTHGWCYYGATGRIYNNGSIAGPFSTFGAGDVISIAIDVPNNLLWVAKNGVWQNSGNPAAGTGYVTNTLTGTIYAAFGAGNTSTPSQTANFGATAFAYTVPTGFNSGFYAVGTGQPWAETYASDSEAVRYAHNLALNPSLWYVPYRMRVVITLSAGNTEMDNFFWKLEDGPELRTVNISTGDAVAFIYSGTNTDVNGSALAIQSGLNFSNAVGGVGTYNIRYKVTSAYGISIIAGPYAVTVTNTLRSGTALAYNGAASWTDAGAPYQTAYWFKDDLGFVHLTGVAAGGTAVAGTVIATLPASKGIRPLNTIGFGNLSNGAPGGFAVLANGQIQFAVGGNTTFGFDGATWYGNPAS